jgi:hypothetical protein
MILAALWKLQQRVERSPGIRDEQENSKVASPTLCKKENCKG